MPIYRPAYSFLNISKWSCWTQQCSGDAQQRSKTPPHLTSNTSAGHTRDGQQHAHSGQSHGQGPGLVGVREDRQVCKPPPEATPISKVLSSDLLHASAQASPAHVPAEDLNNGRRSRVAAGPINGSRAMAFAICAGQSRVSRAGPAACREPEAAPVASCNFVTVLQCAEAESRWEVAQLAARLDRGTPGLLLSQRHVTQHAHTTRASCTAYC